MKELESENFIKDQTIKQLREESEVRIMKAGSRERRLPLRLKFLSLQLSSIIKIIDQDAHIAG